MEETGDCNFREGAEEAQVSHQPLMKCGSDPALPACAGGCFDCNICLDFTVDPVVTLCGHLYCWPCIYKWLQQVDSASTQQCPVCKASLSQSALVPLYGRGHSTKRSHHSLEDIPRWPPSTHRDHMGSEPESPRANTEHDINLRPPILHHRQQHFHLNGYPYGNHISPPASPLRTPTGTWLSHSLAGGVLGGVAIGVLPWVFRNEEAGMVYSSPYNMTGSGGLSPPRLRRQEMQVERSLHQIWVFCCCCVLLCLLLF